MLTLKELLQLNESVTLIEMDVRRPDLTLIKNVIIGSDFHRLTEYQLESQQKGTLEYIDANINRYGQIGRNGFSNTVFGIDFSKIPKKYLDMEVSWIGSLRERYRVEGMELDVTVIPVQMELDDCQWKGARNEQTD